MSPPPRGHGYRPTDDRPHSRACGIQPHAHGTSCRCPHGSHRG